MTGDVVFDIGANLTSVLIALISGVPAIIAAFYAYKANKKAETAVTKVVQTHELVNSRMTEMLSLTREAAHAEGVQDERMDPRVPNVSTDATGT